MISTRRTWALCSGILLYLAAWTLAWLLAEVRLPTEVFPHALVSRGSTQAVVGEAGLIAVLLLGLAWLWSYFTVRSPKRGRRPTVGWFVLGLGLAWFVCLLVGVYKLSEQDGSLEMPLSVLLFSANQPPLWGLLNTLALLLGVALAGFFAAVHYRKMGGGARVLGARAMMRAHEPRLDESPSSEDSAWPDTCPMSEMPEAAQGLRLSLGPTGR
jgi:MFS family permease